MKQIGVVPSSEYKDIFLSEWLLRSEKRAEMQNVNNRWRRSRQENFFSGIFTPECMEKDGVKIIKEKCFLANVLLHLQM